MSNYEPNHICKNEKCTKGKDGGRKHYYACNYCSRTLAWQSVACSFDCYQEYMNQVIEARSKGKSVTVAPERTDMTEAQMEQFMETPVEVVAKETAEELQEFADVNGNVDFAKAVEEINEELNRRTYNVSKKRK